MAKYTSMLTLDECSEVFSHWIQDKLGATTKLTIKKVGTSKAKAEFKVGKTVCTATITMNYNELGYCDAVMHAYHKGHADPVHIKRAIENYGGTTRDTNPWIQRSFERWKALQGNNLSKNRTSVAAAPKAEDLIASNEKAAAEAQYKHEKRDYLDRLPGAAVAQYIYKAAKALQDQAYHQNQVVKTPLQHKYVIKKGFEQPNDFLIMPNHMPTNNQIMKFIESDKFDMPENPYGFTAKDVLDYIKNPPAPIDPNAPAIEPFDTKNYINEKDIAHGVGIMPSMDFNGVITNIQKYLVEPLPNGTDKIFSKEAIVRDSYYIFDHENKLKDDYKPKNVVITEGWATGVSLNDVFNSKNNDNSLVVVAWNAGQIKHAVKNSAERYPGASLIIATDNDVKSFYYANECSAKDLKLVRNTGLQVAIDSCNLHPELAHRLSVIVPSINHAALIGSSYPSDFNDIDSMYGREHLERNISQEINAALQRRRDGIDEIPRLVDMYNAQVKFFSEHLNLPLNMILPTGELNKEAYIPSATLAAQNEAVLKAEMDEDNLINQMADSATAGFFDVEVNDEIKTDFDRKMELSARVLGGKPNLEPEVTNLVANTLAPTVDAPAEQPIIDPATFTAVLYQSHLFNSFNKLQELDNKQEMLQALEAQPMSMDAATKVMQAMFDTTINPHLPNMIGNVLDDYKNQPFYRDLAEIKALMDDNYLQLNEESVKTMQETQRMIVNSFVAQNQHRGLDDEVAEKLVAQEISHQPIESKRVLYAELRDTMKNLNSSDEAWLHSIKETLLESKSAAATITRENTATAEYSPTP